MVYTYSHIFSVYLRGAVSNDPQADLQSWRGKEKKIPASVSPILLGNNFGEGSTALLLLPSRGMR